MLCDRNFPATILCNLKPSPFVWVCCTNNVKPQAYLISLQHRQAKTDINGASNHEMDCLTEYYEILDGQKVTVILLNWTEWFVSCPV